MLRLHWLLLVGAALPCALGLDNGVSPLPPLGWSSWNALRGGYTEATIRAQADAMVSSGMRDAGYRYVNIDDLWAAKNRSASGELLVDPAKFPSGMRALADYLHDRNLSLGLYTDVGTTTCGGQPGSYQHEEQDARTFAAWGCAPTRPTPTPIPPPLLRLLASVPLLLPLTLLLALGQSGLAQGGPLRAATGQRRHGRHVQHPSGKDARCVERDRPEDLL